MDSTAPVQGNASGLVSDRSEREIQRSRGFQILFIDDHNLFREALINLLSGWNQIDKIDDTDSPDAFYQMLRENTYDLIMLDLFLPGHSGLDVLMQLKKMMPETRVLVISQNSDSKDILEAVKLGAQGFIHKTARFSEVKKAIESVALGNEYYAKDILRFIGKFDREHLFSTSSVNETVDLNDRELAVLLYVCKQFTVEETASALDLSVSSVKKYRMSLMEKTQSRNIIGLLAYSLKRGLIKLSDI